LVNTSAQNVLYIIENAIFSKEDIKWNTYTFTWLDNLQPLISSTEIQLLKERDTWILKLKEKRVKLQVKLNECLIKVKELKQKERISDVENICQELDIISHDVEECQKEVLINYYFIS
jgi:hypothetical protein